MKKSRLTIAVIALISVLLVGGTYAFFTDTKSQTNIITMGNVEIDLTEPLFEEDNKDLTVKNVMPGKKIVKDPTITLKGTSNDAYVRAKIEVTGKSMDLNQKQMGELIDGIHFTNGWVLGDNDYYYYNLALTQTDSEVLIFDHVIIPEVWGNETNNLTFEINVTAEAIQAENFNPKTNENNNIIDWVNSKGQRVTVENYSAN